MKILLAFICGSIMILWGALSIKLGLKYKEEGPPWDTNVMGHFILGASLIIGAIVWILVALGV